MQQKALAGLKSGTLQLHDEHNNHQPTRTLPWSQFKMLCFMCLTCTQKMQKKCENHSLWFFEVLSAVTISHQTCIRENSLTKCSFLKSSCHSEVVRFAHMIRKLWYTVFCQEIVLVLISEKTVMFTFCLCTDLTKKILLSFLTLDRARLVVSLCFQSL